MGEKSTNFKIEGTRVARVNVEAEKTCRKVSDERKYWCFVSKN